MEKVVLSDLMDIYEYEKIRNEYRKNMMAFKKDRRVHLGPYISMTFENRKTIRFQIQEMMRAERMVRDEQIQNELDVYNTLLPDDRELSATLFIEITGESLIRPLLNQFIGLTQGGRVWINVGERKVVAEFEAGREKEDKISSVHYLRFHLDDRTLELFRNPSVDASIQVDFKDYHHTVLISPEMRRSLLEDLKS